MDPSSSQIQSTTMPRRSSRRRSNSSLEGLFADSSKPVRRGSRRASRTRSNSSLEGFFPDDCSTSTLATSGTLSSSPSFCSQPSLPEEVMPPVSEEEPKPAVESAEQDRQELRRLSRRLRATKRRLLLQSVGQEAPEKEQTEEPAAVNQLRGLLMKLAVEQEEKQQKPPAPQPKPPKPSLEQKLGKLPQQRSSKMAPVSASSSFGSSQIMQHSPSPSAA